MSIEELRDLEILEKKIQLAKILSENDAKVRQLFHLEKFVTLVNYDPILAKNDNSSVFEQFRQRFDLWSKIADSKSGGRVRSTRRQIHQQQKNVLGDLMNNQFAATLGDTNMPLPGAAVHKVLSGSKTTPFISKNSKEVEEKPHKAGSTSDSNKLSSPSLTNRKRQTATDLPKIKPDSEDINKRKRRKTPSSDIHLENKYLDNQNRCLEEESKLDKADMINDDDENNNLYIYDYENDSDYESDFDPAFAFSEFGPILPKVKLNYKLPPPTITHPSHVAHPEFNNSLDDYLSSYVTLDDDMTKEELEVYIKSQVELRQQIEQARLDGVLFDVNGEVGGINASKLKPYHDAERPITHHDHLVSHAIFFAKLMSEERKAHVSKAKKVATMIDLHSKRLKGADEKERKFEEKRIRQVARKTGQEVMKKWKLAEKVVLQRLAQRKQEEQRKEGKKQLNQILEKSALLLEARAADMTPISSGDTHHLIGDRVERQDAHSSGDEDDHISNLDSNTDKENSDFDDIEDDSLSVEELRRKYHHLENIKVQQNFEDEEINARNNEYIEDEGDNNSGDNVELHSEDSDTDLEFEQSFKDNFSGTDESGDSSSMDSDGDSSSGSESSDIPEVSNSSRLSALLGNEFNGSEADGDSEDYGVDSDYITPDVKNEETSSKLGISEVEPDKNSSVDDNIEAVKREPCVSISTEKDVASTTPPFLLRGTLRKYQHLGLDWLVGLYNSNTNGILADEMGLGKTIQTISLISYLACEKEIWGPHLIVVPTSVMLNWEMEFKRFAPGFKVMTYYGSPAQRKEKRRGWNKDNTWHICITSYQLVIQDQYAFRRKKWHYMILDEAHNIKNFRSQRWQALLNFNTERRLLLTGTPLQNNLIELWSLLYFLMPSSKASSMSMPDGFANLKDFQEWFARPVDKMVEGGEMADQEARATVHKLHQILRPYLLRRLKADVEKQMPAKYEHIVYCRLSKRQRYLYDDFMSRAQTKETLASGNFLSIINCLMQLRKVCNHPDLFEVRPIVTSLAVPRSVAADYEIKDLLIRRRLLSQENNVDFGACNLIVTKNEDLSTYDADSMIKIQAHDQLNEECRLFRESIGNDDSEPDFITMEGHARYRNKIKLRAILERTQHALYLSDLRSQKTPIYGRNVLRLCSSTTKPDPLMIDDSKYDWTRNDLLAEVQVSPKQRQTSMIEVIDKFSFVTPPVVCLDMCKWIFQGLDDDTIERIRNNNMKDDPFHQSQVKLSIAFPDKRLLQYDCGKLQRLAFLLQDLTAEGHRALIFTQMTKVLDILEQFLNIHGYRYLRLDGSTKIEQRQIMTERFNTDPKIPVFILSTRSGGLGINLTGADTVIFYDSDWNPSMDKQCQDRCHRIGQTRDVHIYRLVSEYTIESNILKKANQKSILDDVVIQEGEFTTDYFSKISVRDMLGDEVDGAIPTDKLLLEENLSSKSIESALASAEDAEDSAAAKAAMREVNVDAEDFDESRARSMSVSRAVSQTPVPEKSSTAEPDTVLPDDNYQDTETAQTSQLISVSLNETGDEEEEEIGDIDDYMIRFIEGGWFWDTR
ncbi:hypothetical protein NADFUDRAFT_20676 [Nadsonia fulvescens var. elongata DSM 6958]|uniref:Helicase SWR1 n=1 Tax=Nadsonia fulvescens var. elongata DSM 6958 TaxID=857566 RepID=A0A1E3PTU2_9ASCO|nr:hypothetical protein NADFUDRAFT_20676 [Nadsonia fulvescens var. elongata DSM 6958]